jgi:hypothetical protein
VTALLEQAENIATYNSLEPVETIDERLTRAGRDRVLQELGKIIVSHRLHEVIGVRLLHRHNDLALGEIMLEREELDSTRSWCLTTVATLKAEVPSDYRPNSWKLCDDRFVPIEFSFDPEAVLAVAAVDQRFAFHTEFARVLQELGADNILGPWVAPRSFYRYCPGHDAILLESCDSARRANILRYGDPAQHALRLIETTWVFQPSNSAPDASTDCNNHCIASCLANCTPVSACVVDSQGNHGSQSGHVNSHNQLHG